MLNFTFFDVIFVIFLAINLSLFLWWISLFWCDFHWFFSEILSLFWLWISLFWCDFHWFFSEILSMKNPAWIDSLLLLQHAELPSSASDAVLRTVLVCEMWASNQINKFKKNQSVYQQHNIGNFMNQHSPIFIYKWIVLY